MGTQSQGVKDRGKMGEKKRRYMESKTDMMNCLDTTPSGDTGARPASASRRFALTISFLPAMLPGQRNPRAKDDGDRLKAEGYVRRMDGLVH